MITEGVILKAAVGIHLIRNAAEHTDATLADTEHSISKLCGVIADGLKLNQQELITEGKAKCDLFPIQFTQSDSFATLSAKVTPTLIWLNVLPGYNS